MLGPPFDFYVYGTRLYQLIAHDPPQYAPASALSTIGLCLILPLIVLQRWLLARRRYTTITGKMRLKTVSLGRWRFGGFNVRGSRIGSGCLLLFSRRQVFRPFHREDCGD